MFKKKNPSDPGRGAIGYCCAEAGFKRVSELYPEDIVKNPVPQGCIIFILPPPPGGRGQKCEVLVGWGENMIIFFLTEYRGEEAEGRGI